MFEQLEIWEQPKEKEIYVLAGWRQWADGGSISSGLPRYLIRQTNAHKIGEIRDDGYYLFQLPVTQDLMRPVIRFKEGYPETLRVHRNDFYYTSMGDKGLVIFTGDEPHLNVERYTQTFLEAVKRLGARRVVLFGGVYAEVPYERDRYVVGSYSMPRLKDEMASLAVNLSDYHGGASIGSYVCRRAGEAEIELVGLYSFTPVFQFVGMEEMTGVIQIGKDFKAWRDVMQRVKHMLDLGIDLEDLEKRSTHLIKQLDARVEELDSHHPDLELREYMQRLSEEFEIETFTPLADVWHDELRRLGDQFYPDEE